jgi:hypothetical protein
MKAFGYQAIGGPLAAALGLLASSSPAGTPATSGAAASPTTTAEAATPTAAQPATVESAAPAPVAGDTPSAVAPSEAGAPAAPPPNTYAPAPPLPNPYTDPYWLRLFWDDRDKAVELLDEDLQPQSELDAPAALAVGIPLLVLSPISLFAGLVQTLGAMGGIWDCDGSANESACESERSDQRTLGALGLVGGFLGAATGITLTVVGATSKTWLDPSGKPIPKPGELAPVARSPVQVDVAFGSGGAVLRGAW